MKKAADDFTQLYKVNKTLEFSLLPQGKTLKHLNEEGFIKDDIKRAEDYKKAKKLLDDYHRWFIDKTLKSFESYDWKNLCNNYLYKWQKANSQDKQLIYQKLKSKQADVRKSIKECFKEQREYKFLKLKKLITKLVPEHYNDNEKIECLDSFENHFCYFESYNNNRMFIYSGEEKSGTVAYRIVNENLPKYYNNIKIFNKACDLYGNEFVSLLQKNIEKIVSSACVVNYFDIDKYNLVLSQRGISLYNMILGGAVIDGIKIQGLNELLNEYHQKFNKEKRSKRLICEPLFNQILCSDVKAPFYLCDKFFNDKQVIESILNYFYDVFKHEEFFNEFFKGLSNIENFDFNNVYINFSKNNDSFFFSRHLFDDGFFIRNSFIYCAENKCGPCEKITRKTEREKWIKKDYFSIDEINASIKYKDRCIDNFRMNEYGLFLKDLYYKCRDILPSLDLLLKEYCCDKSTLLPDNDDHVEKIKELFDLFNSFVHSFQIFKVPEEEIKDNKFYVIYNKIVDIIGVFYPLLNKVRNYVTSNLNNSYKIKLNFGCSNLLAGWHHNKETDYLTTILLKDGKYFLAILNKNSKLKSKLYKNLHKDKGGDNYKKVYVNVVNNFMCYVPKNVFINCVDKHFKESDNNFVLDSKRFIKPLIITKEIYDLHHTLYTRVLADGKEKSFKKYQKDYLDYIGDAEGYNQALQQWISFCFEFCKCYRSASVFNLEVLENSYFDSYQSFINEIQKYLYDLSFIDVSAKQIDKYVEDGDLFLFEIYCKDFSEHSYGNKNLNALYFLHLFDNENLKTKRIKLDGGGKVFYRPKSLLDPFIHLANEKIVNRSYIVDGNRKVFMPEDVHLELVNYVNGRVKKHQLSKLACKLYDSGKISIKNADFDIVKDKRYTKDSFLLHLPVSLNCNSEKMSPSVLNSKVLKIYSYNEKLNIIGIDRGERNLLYVSVINQKGEILEQRSLNDIDFNTIQIDYRKKLDLREKERQKQRKSWKKISQIKDLKKGYLSAVIREICKLMIKYNAVIAMEDLNLGFKHSRAVIEKQVYQNFEKALITKLNYLAFKPNVVSPYDKGGIQKGYQLSNKFESFKKLGKQSGFLFYVPAWNTSSIDPTTGFVNLFKDLKYHNLEDSQKFFSKMDSVYFDEEKDYFVFNFDFNNFSTYCKPSQRKWSICSSDDDRCITIPTIVNGRKVFKTIIVNISSELKRLFNNYGINYSDGHDLKNDIVGIKNVDFYKMLLNNFKNLVKLRFSTSADDKNPKDYIISPVMNKNGIFFNSEKCKNNLPVDADANGAYHIALKCLFMLQTCVVENERGLLRVKAPKNPNEQWLEFVQSRF